ncbi:hypothetical protein CO670_15350 [Rhizobium sp. J15]|uniref:hypothetical protein n=1 Tax=Rhizobium sp. J15 TaxID=2035450 RepID=UPI000BEA2F65|nr:hypothetical protein [Rhizobium sp. J15]PDT15871.1 hypothetical protein CO670_15350 [Rhizobium sp. J15]
MSKAADFYELSPAYRVEPGGFASAAIISCSLCGDTIDGMGGPGRGAVCLKCAAEMIAGRLRGCVIWENSDPASA